MPLPLIFCPPALVLVDATLLLPIVDDWRSQPLQEARLVASVSHSLALPILFVFPLGGGNALIARVADRVLGLVWSLAAASCCSNT